MKLNCRLSSFTAPYVVCEVENVNFLVNSTYKMFVNALAQKALHQGDDIRLFFDLTKEYYGIESVCEGDIFFDIGGNIGTTSIYVKKVVNPLLKIISFEPDEENCRQFKCSCILNGIDKDDICLVQAALSDENGEASIMLSDKTDNMGDHRVLINGNILSNRETEKVKKIRLDTWLETNHIDISRIKYVWMDVQAHEGFVLSGGANVFIEHKIPLFMEFWPKELKRNHSFDLLVDTLGRCYSKFICVQWYKQGKRELLDIYALHDIARKYPDDTFDIFLVK